MSFLQKESNIVKAFKNRCEYDDGWFSKLNSCSTANHSHLSVKNTFLSRKLVKSSNENLNNCNLEVFQLNRNCIKSEFGIELNCDQICNCNQNDSRCSQVNSKSKYRVDSNYRRCINIDHNIAINKELNPHFCHDDYRRLETVFIRNLHGTDILTSMLENERKLKCCLNNHFINENSRARMVDWMIEVVSCFKCDENVFFNAVNLMDEYLSLEYVPLCSSDLHLIGVTCMFLSSKCYDLTPIRLETICDRIAHKKLSADQIKAKEVELIKIIDYKVSLTTTWDFTLAFLEEVFVTSQNGYNINCKRLLYDSGLSLITLETEHDKDIDELCSKAFKSFTPNLLHFLKQICLYLTKMAFFDCEIFSDSSPSIIAAGAIFVGVKISEKVNKTDYFTEWLLQKLTCLSKGNQSEISEVAQKILFKAQNSEVSLANFVNLKKVHFNSLIELRHTK